MEDLVGGPLFLPLYKYYTECGGIYKLCFGPKVFMVVSDPIVLRHILKENVSPHILDILLLRLRYSTTGSVWWCLTQLSSISSKRTSVQIFYY